MRVTRKRSPSVGQLSIDCAIFKTSPSKGKATTNGKVLNKRNTDDRKRFETKMSEIFRDDSILLRDSAKTSEPKLHRISPFSRESRVIVSNER